MNALGFYVEIRTNQFMGLSVYPKYPNSDSHYQQSHLFHC